MPAALRGRHPVLAALLTPYNLDPSTADNGVKGNDCFAFQFMVRIIRELVITQGDIFKLFQVFALGLRMNNIKQRLSAKPASLWRSDRFVSESSIRFINLHGLTTTTSSSRIRQKLRIAAFLETHKPEDRLFDRPTDSQKTMVLEKSSFLISQCLGDVLTLLFSQNNPLERIVKCQVLDRQPSPC